MLEGTIIHVTDKSGGSGSQNNYNSSSSSSKRGVPGGPIGNGQASGIGGSKGETYSVDTSNILFILSGAFVGLEKTIQNRMAKGVSAINCTSINRWTNETSSLSGLTH